MHDRAPQRRAARAAAPVVSLRGRFEFHRQSRALPRRAWRDAFLLRRCRFRTRRDHEAGPAPVSACTQLARTGLGAGLDGRRQLRVGHPSRRGVGPVDCVARARNGEVAGNRHSNGALANIVGPWQSARLVMRGLILAGGRGSRLAADGVETPKALVEVAGRPQLVNLIETFAGLGCDSITCMVRDGISVDLPAPVPAIVRTCRTPSSLHTLVAGLAVASLHRMRAFLRLLVELKAPVATVEVPRIIDLDHKSDLEAAERWLAASAKS